MFRDIFDFSCLMPLTDTDDKLMNNSSRTIMLSNKIYKSNVEKKFSKFMFFSSSTIEHLLMIHK